MTGITFEDRTVLVAVHRKVLAFAKATQCEKAFRDSLAKNAYALSGPDAARFLIGDAPKGLVEVAAEQGEAKEDYELFSLTAKLGYSPQADLFLSRAERLPKDFLDWGAGRVFLADLTWVMNLLEES